MRKVLVDNRSRHAPHRACRLVLGKNCRAEVIESARAGQAIMAHARQHHCKQISSIDPSSGTEEHIDGGPAMIFERCLIQAWRRAAELRTRLEFPDR